MPVRTPDRKMGRDVVLAYDHQGRSRHLGKAGVPEERELRRESTEIRTAVAGRGQQHTRLNPGLGQIHFGSILIGRLSARKPAAADARRTPERTR